jgi:hypothetical protein
MSSTVTIRADELPAEMRVLLEDYPRDSWPTHAGFKDKTRQWLGAHQSFRRLSATVCKDAESFLDGDEDAKDYVDQLVYRGGALVRNLHGHHGWEDHSYLPELSAADPRFDAGLEILEKDHIALHELLDSFTESANRAIAMIQLDDEKHRSEVGALYTAAQTIEALLQRHLADEEELAVPIILHHRLRG